MENKVQPTLLQTPTDFSQESVEKFCNESAERVQQTLLDHASLGLTNIIPFGIILGKTNGEAVINAVVLPLNVKPSQWWSMMAATTRQAHGVGFVLGYDCYVNITTHEEPSSAVRKDAIVVMWATKWGLKEIRITPYVREGEKTIIEPSIPTESVGFDKNVLNSMEMAFHSPNDPFTS